jgi:two-component system, NtrC family, nitrogen regulation sensor histidine kinase GlnL
MSARSQQSANNPDESFNLAPALRDCLSPGVLVVNHREQILSCTPEAERLLALAPGQTHGAALSLLPLALQTYVRPILTRQLTVFAGELTVNFGSQPSRTFYLNAVPVSIGSENLAVVLTLTDLTGLTRLQQSLERLDRLATAGTLAAGMAHEVKNALVAVKTFVDLLLEQNKDSELATLVGREMDRVNAIIRQLLKFGGSRQPVRAPVRMHDVLEHSLRMVHHQLRDKLISLNRAFKSPLDTVHGDNHQLEQVFVNLFLNAVDATGPNGSLTVQTELIEGGVADGTDTGLSRQPHVRITVADTGVGITPEHLAQLFQPFFTTKSHGTGLGLPITRRIVEEHQGLITVASQPNHGTTISIILPAGPQPS